MDEKYLVLAWIRPFPGDGWSCVSSICLMAIWIPCMTCMEMSFFHFLMGSLYLCINFRSAPFIMYMNHLFIYVENISFQIIICLFYLTCLRYLALYANVLIALKSNLSLFFISCFLDSASYSTAKIKEIFLMLLSF